MKLSKPIKPEKEEVVPQSDITDIAEHSIIERQLITSSTLDATLLILKENDGEMTQELLRRKLDYYNHTWNEADDKILRGNHRLRFMGTMVHLKEEPK